MFYSDAEGDGAGIDSFLRECAGDMLFRTERDIHNDSPSQLKILYSFIHSFIHSFFPSLIVGRNRRSGIREVE